MKRKDQELDKFIRDLALKIEKGKQEFQGNYFLNAENYAKFQEVFSYFTNFAKENSGEIVGVSVDPRDIHGDIQIDVPLVDLYKTGLREFADTLKKVDVFGITPVGGDNLRLDITVNYLWKAVSSK